MLSPHFFCLCGREQGSPAYVFAVAYARVSRVNNGYGLFVFFWGKHELRKDQPPRPSVSWFGWLWHLRHGEVRRAVLRLVQNGRECPQDLRRNCT